MPSFAFDAVRSTNQNEVKITTDWKDLQMANVNKMEEEPPNDIFSVVLIDKPCDIRTLC